MTRTLHILGGYIRRFLLLWLASRSFAFTLVANQSVTPLIGLAVWSSALPEANLTTYYLALLVTRLVTVSYEQHTFSGRIYTGELIDDLLRPHAAVLATLGENLALRFWHLAIGLPAIIAVLLLTPVQWAPTDLLLALPALIGAAALQFLFTYTLALSAFWTERAHGVVGIGGVLVFLLGGEAAPVPLLPEAVRPLAAALPFRAMHGFPAEIAAGTLGSDALVVGYAWQALWLVVFVLGAWLVWRRGIRRFTAVGG
jgi:ABC-2 type transport system permease protein